MGKYFTLRFKGTRINRILGPYSRNHHQKRHSLYKNIPYEKKNPVLGRHLRKRRREGRKGEQTRRERKRRKRIML